MADWLPKEEQPLAMLLKESTSKVLLKMPLAGVEVEPIRRGNISFPLVVFLGVPLNWKKLWEGFFLGTAIAGQVRRGVLLSFTLSDVGLFVPELTLFGLPGGKGRQK